MGIYAKVNGEWKSVDGADAGLVGLGGWATITSVEWVWGCRTVTLTVIGLRLSGMVMVV